jgi:hypothetical protein
VNTEHETNTKPQQLADMLGVAMQGTPNEVLDPAELTAGALRNRLEGPLPPDTGIATESLTMLDNIYNELVPGGRRSLGEALTEPKTDISTILRIKNHAKQSVTKDTPRPQRTASLTIYYAAISSALLFHDLKITTYSYEALAVSLAKLIDKPWIPPELSEHLQAARNNCLDRRDQAQ